MIRHLRTNAVAYLALFVALGGSAYAASKITSADIKDNTIKGKDIRSSQVTGADLRDESATGADIANGSLDTSDVKDGGLTGGDIADKSIGGTKVDPATKVPNADMLDGHGSTRYGVGLQMGTTTALVDGGQNRFPVGLTDDATLVPMSEHLAISPETLEIRDFTASAPDGLEAGESIVITVVNGTPNTPVCTLTSGAPSCHTESNLQWAVPGQALWGLTFFGSGDLDGTETVTYSYRAVR